MTARNLFFPRYRVINSNNVRPMVDGGGGDRNYMDTFRLMDARNCSGSLDQVIYDSLKRLTHVLSCLAPINFLEMASGSVQKK